MQILALGGVFDWPVPATGCDMANELLCPLRTNYGSLHSASILSLSVSPSPLSRAVPQWASAIQHSSLCYRTAAGGSSRPWKTKASSDFLQMAIPDVRNPGLEQSSARNSPFARLQHGKRTIIIITTTISFWLLERNRNPFKV